MIIIESEKVVADQEAVIQLCNRVANYAEKIIVIPRDALKARSFTYSRLEALLKFKLE